MTEIYISIGGTINSGNIRVADSNISKLAPKFLPHIAYILSCLNQEERASIMQILLEVNELMIKSKGFSSLQDAIKQQKEEKLTEITISEIKQKLKQRGVNPTLLSKIDKDVNFTIPIFIDSIEFDINKHYKKIKESLLIQLKKKPSTIIISGGTDTLQYYSQFIATDPDIILNLRNAHIIFTASMKDFESSPEHVINIIKKVRAESYKDNNGKISILLAENIEATKFSKFTLYDQSKHRWHHLVHKLKPQKVKAFYSIPIYEQDLAHKRLSPITILKCGTNADVKNILSGLTKLPNNIANITGRKKPCYIVEFENIKTIYEFSDQIQQFNKENLPLSNKVDIIGAPSFELYAQSPNAAKNAIQKNLLYLSNAQFLYIYYSHRGKKRNMCPANEFTQSLRVAFIPDSKYMKEIPIVSDGTKVSVLPSNIAPFWQQEILEKRGNITLDNQDSATNKYMAGVATSGITLRP